MSPPRRKKRRGTVKDRVQKNPAPPDAANGNDAPGWASIRRRVPLRIVLPVIVAVTIAVIAISVGFTENRPATVARPDAGRIAPPAGDRPAGDRPASSKTRQPLSRDRARPLTWFGQTYSPTVPEKEMLMFQGRILIMMRIVPPRGRFLENLLDGLDVRKRILDAKRAVVESPWPPEMWRGDDVRRIVSEIGDARPVYEHNHELVRLDPQLMGGHSELGFAYHPLEDGFSATVDAILGWSDSALRGTLVHEATHLVFTRDYLAMAGFEPRELALLEMGCSDIAMAMRVLNEAMAYRNEALWYEAQAGGKPPDTERKARVYAMALDAERGDESKIMTFARFLQNYAEAAMRPDLRRSAPKRVDCGPPIAFRGERQGSVVLPSDPAPKILVPLLDALAREP